jgi:lipopolysaccharide export LptBFGC system permease protein LptF
MLELEEARREQRGSAFLAGRIAVPIDLSALISTGPRSEKDLSYEALLSGAGSSPSERRRNRLSAEYHFRLAMAVSPLLLGALAAPLGIVFRIRNRAVVFLVGVLVLAAGYLPIILVATLLAENGAAPAWAVLQVPNLLLVVAAFLLSAKANRP